MNRRLPVAAALLAAALILVMGADTLHASTVVIDRTDYNPYRGDTTGGPNISFALDRPDAVTHLTVDLTYATEGFSRLDLKVNGERVFSTSQSGHHRVTVVPGDRSGVQLGSQNNLTIAVKQNFGTAPARIDRIRVTAPTRGAQATTTGMRGLAVLAILAALYLVGAAVASRHNKEEWYRGVAARLGWIGGIITLVGAFFAVGNVMLFLALEPGVATPIMQDGIDTVQRTTRAALTDQYDSGRETVCVRGFDSPADCSVASMEQQLATRQVETYADVRTVLADAHRVAYLIERRTLAAPFSGNTFVEPVTRLLMVGFVDSGFSIERAWRHTAMRNVTRRCAAQDIPPRDCLARITTVLDNYTTRFDDGAVPQCARLTLDESAADLRSQTSNQTLVAFFLALDDIPVGTETDRALWPCTEPGRFRSTTLSMVLDIAYTMRVAAIVMADVTSGISERTGTVDAALAEAIP